MIPFKFKVRIASPATALLFLLVVARQADAAAVPSRPCVAGDLDGIYMLVDFKEVPDGAMTRTAEQAPYRVLAFFPPSTWSQMAFNMMPASSERVMAVLKPQMASQRFTLQADGRIILNRGQAVQFAGTCAVSLHTGGGFQENDLILAGNEIRNPSEVHELLRRWTGGPIPKAVSSFDPAPSSVTQEHPASAAESSQPSMPEQPSPFRVQVLPNGGPNTTLSVVVTNEAHAPLSAFMLVFRGKQTAQRWKDLEVDACLEHHVAWQPGQRWTKDIGLPIAVGNIEIHPGAAIFSDGSTWGDPQRLAKLKTHRGNCEWPGS